MAWQVKQGCEVRRAECTEGYCFNECLYGELQLNKFYRSSTPPTSSAIALLSAAAEHPVPPVWRRRRRFDGPRPGCGRTCVDDLAARPSGPLARYATRCSDNSIDCRQEEEGARDYFDATMGVCGLQGEKDGKGAGTAVQGL